VVTALHTVGVEVDVLNLNLMINYCIRKTILSKYCEPRILYFQQSHECIDFTMMFFFGVIFSDIFWSDKSASIFNIGGFW